MRHTDTKVLLVLAGLASGCFGSFHGAATEDGDQGGVNDDDDDDAGGRAGSRGGAGAGGTVVPPGACEPSPRLPNVRRLSRVEYLSSMAQLIPGGSTDLVLDRDPSVTKFENDAAALGATAVFVEQVARNAELAAKRAVGNLSGLLACPAATAERACVEAFLRRFGRRVYRRPLAEDEVRDHLVLYDALRAKVDHAGAVELVVSALLQSPELLYRLPGDSESLPFRRAERLAFLLWQAPPDDALLDAAARGDLADEAGVVRTARQLMAAAPARVGAAFVDFHRQWMDADRILAPNWSGKDQRLYPAWNEGVVTSVRTEADGFVGAVFARGGSLKGLLTDTTVVADARIASLYGLPAAGRHEVPQRPGILSRSFFLASHAHGRSGSPPLRGHAIMQRLFCASLPDPPADADTSDPAASEDASLFTNRELFERRVAHAPCNGCHQVMDAFAYPLEAYDATGAFRTMENGKSVTTETKLRATDVDGSYPDLAAMATAMAGSEQVKRCVASNLAAWATGRVMEADAEDDQCLVDDVARRLGEAPLTDAMERLAELVTSTP